GGARRGGTAAPGACAVRGGAPRREGGVCVQEAREGCRGLPLKRLGVHVVDGAVGAAGPAAGEGGTLADVPVLLERLERRLERLDALEPAARRVEAVLRREGVGAALAHPGQDVFGVADRRV